MADDAQPPTKPPDAVDRTPLREIAALFLRLGTIAFGGPAAHVAMMEDEVVRRRGWLSQQDFLDLLGATNLIPGPNSTEMAIHIGYHRARWPGLIVAGVCFILPSTLIVLVLAWAYARYGQLPAAEGLLYGVKPVVIAIIVQALWRLARAAVKTPFLAAMFIAAAAANFLGVHELIVLFGAAAVVAGGEWILGLFRGRGLPAHAWPIALPLALSATPGAGAAGAAAGSATLAGLFWFFLKVGSVLFGSGYVLIAFIEADLVDRLNWLTEAQLLDAVAVGQVTPGPVSTTATFIGFVLRGWQGAAVATLGMFIPAFFFVAVSSPLVPRMRGSRTAGRLLDGVNVAALALMVVVAWDLGRSAVVDPLTGGLAALSAVLLIRFNLNSTWLVAMGAAAGLAAAWFAG